MVLGVSGEPVKASIMASIMDSFFLSGDVHSGSQNCKGFSRAASPNWICQIGKPCKGFQPTGHKEKLLLVNRFSRHISFHKTFQSIRHVSVKFSVQCNNAMVVIVSTGTSDILRDEPSALKSNTFP